MIIENPDAFKGWLTTILEPLCDADPAALAKYVYALVKKDKPLDELRDGMLDQLDVFLQQETKPFVEMLFKSLEGQEYLKLAAAAEAAEPAPETLDQTAPAPSEPSPPAPAAPALAAAPAPAPTPAPSHPGNVREKSPGGWGAAPRQRVVLRGSAAHERPAAPAPRHEQTLLKVMPLTELLEEPIDMPVRRRDRRDGPGERRRRRSRSRSWERRARRRHDGSPRRKVSRSPSPRRYRNRSPPPPALDRTSRSRSRSPVGARERPEERARDKSRLRQRERDRASRDRTREEPDRLRERSHERALGSASPPREGARAPHAAKRRCRDFDEKGYCMRGDLCQFDHGDDPVVLDDALPGMLLPPSVPEYNPLAPDIWGGGAMPPFAPRHLPPPPPRALIPIPRIRDAPPPVAPQPPAPRHPAPLQKRNFDYHRQGPPRSNPGANAANCSLEVKKVPRGLNDITHLNNHFGKFGKIVNIQVCYDGDPEGALITFASHTVANVAYKSTEAVLNNRFIKVFWHNAESKQENSQAAANKPAPPPAAPFSHNKVLINKDNIKASSDHRLQAEKLHQQQKAQSNGQADKTAAAPPASGPTPVPTPGQTPGQTAGHTADRTRVMDMHRRAQSLLETQLQQQVLLIQKLEQGNVTGPQKAALMEAINSAQEGIEKLRKELVAYNKTLLQMQEEKVARSLNRLQIQAKKPKTREEAQKEILDAELDLFTKQQEGQDVTELQKRILELRRQMAVQFPHPAARRIASRGRYTLGRASRAAPPPPRVFNNQSVDHRPRALLVSGFEADELDQVVRHFMQFGEVCGREVNLSVPELSLQFKLRAQAELAAARGRHYNERTLKITWVTGGKPSAPLVQPAAAATAAAAAVNVNVNVNGTATHAEASEVSRDASEDSLLRFDEEDDDDAEDRSWRR